VRRLAIVLAASGLLLAGCGGGKIISPKPTTVIGPIPTGPSIKGDPVAGKQVFISQGCGSCHTFSKASSTGTTGPNLDKGLKGKTPDFVKQSIVSPNAVITPGYPPNIMPQTYGSTLTPKQLADVVAFLTQK
jgi:mono/diheme cytochrome c family protein